MKQHGSSEQDIFEGVGTAMEDLVGTYSKKQDDCCHYIHRYCCY
jgi:hypothetical protein